MISLNRLMSSVFEPIVNEMSSNSKKYLITTETKDIFIVRQGSSKCVRWFCDECQMETDMLNLDVAVEVTKIHSMQILKKIQAGKIHSVETANGYLLLCANSLEGISKCKK